MVCPNPNMIMVDTCEGSETDCVVVSNRECESIFCQEPEVACMASPTCQEDEVESFGSENACVDDGSTCTEVSECGVTIYCRPAREVALLYCEEPITNPIGLDSARIEDDQLFFGLMLSGGCGLAPIFPGCFSDFQESSLYNCRLLLLSELRVEKTLVMASMMLKAHLIFHSSNKLTEMLINPIMVKLSSMLKDMIPLLNIVSDHCHQCIVT